MVRLLVRFAVAWAACSLLWLLFAFQLSRAELLAGAIAGAIGALALLVSLRVEALCFRPRLRWLLPALDLPRLIAVDLIVLARVLVRRVQGRPSTSLLQTARFATGFDQAVAGAQRTLVVLFASIPPNSVVVGIDQQEQYVLLHQLEASAAPGVLRQVEA